MARVRRKTSASTRWNLEIAGILALGFALLLGVALVAPPARVGVIGGATAFALHALFGAAAGLFALLIALVAAIVFLEINVPRMIATFGGAACAYFVAIDIGLAAAGRDGGKLGRALDGVLHALLGDAGVWIVLVVAVLAVTISITGVSLKKVIGWGIASVGALRGPKTPARKTARKAIEGPRTLREAFHLPALLPRAAVPASANAAASTAEIPPPTHTVVEPESRVYDEDLEDEEIEDDEELEDDDELEGGEDEEYDDEEYDEDEEYEEDEDGEFDDNDETVEEPDEDQLDDVESGVADRTASTALATIAAADAALGGAGDLDAGEVSGEYEPAEPKIVYRLPDLNLFDPPQTQKNDDANRAHILEDTLASFGVGGKVTHIERGPSITRYELKPERGVKISRIASLADDLALALAATSVRIEAPIPGKSAVGIEVPNATVSVVAIREILEYFPNRGSVPPLNMALGKDITGKPVFGDLGKMPHLLVAGATGAGKSVCLNCIIASLLVSATPDQVQILMIDPKRVELTVYNGIPHLIKDVITDARIAAGALFEMTKEMDQRYERFARAGVRKIEEYNAKFPDEKLPFVVIIIDELADLMLVAPAKVEQTIMRLAQLARATGIHLIVATQRPSVDVITGIIKANIPSRIAFAVSSQVDSRTILDMGGAERLLGRGDMLFLPIDKPKPVRAQGALITGEEVNKLVAFWAAQGRPENVVDFEVVPIDESEEQNGKKSGADPLWFEAAQFLMQTKINKGESGVGSTAQLQQRFSIGHPRAVRLMKQLEEFGVVGPNEGTKPRNVLIESPADLERLGERFGRPTTQADLFPN
ncbi:MAG TPA: DNA translocase FtsK [Candidatus Acidoferrum sp.]|nr:DNA translocase FtsK [Candidatus Acidoferrum sp.]